MCAECALLSAQTDLYSYLEVSVLNEYGADRICVQSVLAWISIHGLDAEQISSASTSEGLAFRMEGHRG